jgi:hypothetical protein
MVFAFYIQLFRFLENEQKADCANVVQVRSHCASDCI